MPESHAEVARLLEEALQARLELLARRPTVHPPGHPKKVQVLATRARCRRQLFHPLDAPPQLLESDGLHDAHHNYRPGSRPRGAGRYHNAKPRRKTG